MRVYEICEQFGLENLKLVTRPTPESPGPGKLLIRMKAVSLNYRDLMMVKGQYNPRQPLPLIPCSDGVGEVVAAGEGVKRFQAGDRVCPIFAQSWIDGELTPEARRSTLGGPLDGALAEYMVVDEAGLVRPPDHLDDVEAATLPCAAVTAWNALTAGGSVAAGDTVLVQGSGGVSTFALKFAGAVGAAVIATSSSDEKLEKLRELGARHTINYRKTPEWGDLVREQTGGRGVDRVIEVGGAQTLQQSLKAVRMGGMISMIGVLSGAAAEISIAPILMQQVCIQGFLVGHRRSFEAMNEAIARHQLHPVVDRSFPFEDTLAAFERLASGAHFGKICICF